MPGTDDTDRMKQLAITLVDAYVRKDRDLLDQTVAEVGDDTEGAVSELKVFGSFLSRRVQETGVVWKPADSREAVASAVADMLPPEVEFAVITVWEAYSLGEEEAAERFTNGDPTVYLHMLAAFSAAIGQAVYKPAELISTLRIASGGSE
ncbi:hypothetical protein [Streptomonospora litoralis]|uniref:Uncharacterized protein n=1 Tax=Streptomonospora litoralis TaxID=2498135 RepID=A0A4P6Q8K9_9ACTN|nr:hypothetical protein [Streptomonospora litoralis]QBI55307.1 hypothetical protein EKD16_17695 [Streptomonospora litoralis]